jgi:hypothetical protein
MMRPKLRYLLASIRCILQVTPGYRTPHGYMVSRVCFSEAGLEDRAIDDVSQAQKTKALR